MKLMILSSPTPSYKLVNTKGCSPRTFSAVRLHQFQRRIHLLSNIDSVDNQQVGFGDAGAVLGGNLVAGGDVVHVPGKVDRLQAE